MRYLCCGGNKVEPSYLSRAQFREIVLATFDAALRPDTWPEVCDRVADATSATAFMIFEYNFNAHQAPIFHGSRVTRLGGAPLVEAMKTSIPPEEQDGYARFGALPAGRLFSEYEVYGASHDSEMPPNPFRDAVLAAGASRSRNVARLNDIGPWSDVSALHLPMFGADIPRSLRVDMDALIPIFGKAFETSRAFHALIFQHRMILDVFDRLDFACAILKSDGRLVASNRRLNEVVQDNDGLRFVSGALAAHQPADWSALRRCIAAAFNASAPAAELLCLLNRPSGRLPLIARSAPIRSPYDRRRGGDCCLLIILDPEDQRRISASGLAAFGLLTPAELEICDMIVQGFSIPEIANRRGTSPETVKNQTKSVISKLACRSRTDLVRLAISTHPPLVADAAANSRNSLDGR